MCNRIMYEVILLQYVRSPNLVREFLFFIGRRVHDYDAVHAKEDWRNIVIDQFP